MFDIAKSGSNPTLRVLALRGYLKLMAVPSQRSNAESARMLGQVMPLATGVAEKRAALALLPGFPCAESLDVARSALNDPAVVAEAKAAVTRIEQRQRRSSQ